MNRASRDANTGFDNKFMGVVAFEGGKKRRVDVQHPPCPLFHKITYKKVITASQNELLCDRCIYR
jgi:hypothetical protein